MLPKKKRNGDFLFGQGNETEGLKDSERGGDVFVFSSRFPDGCVGGGDLRWESLAGGEK